MQNKVSAVPEEDLRFNRHRGGEDSSTYQISVSLMARSWKSTRKKNNAEICGAVLYRLLLSAKIHLWGTAITGRRSVFLKQRDYPSVYG